MSTYHCVKLFVGFNMEDWNEVLENIKEPTHPCFEYKINKDWVKYPEDFLVTTDDDEYMGFDLMTSECILLDNSVMRKIEDARSCVQRETGHTPDVYFLHYTY
jgi:hypothetical protein